MPELVKIEGLKDLEAALAELPKATGKSVLRRVLAKAALPILDAAKSRAIRRPDDAKPVYYGRKGAKKLRRPGTDEVLIQAGTRLTKNQARQARKEGKNYSEYYVGSRDPIARLIEYGTSDTPAHPIFRPAWEGGKDDALKIISEELGGEIEKAAVRVAKKAAKLAAAGGGDG